MSSWLENEPGPATQLAEVARLVRRARRRPLATAATCAVCALTVLGLSLRKPELHTARTGMVLTESALSDDKRPFSRGEIRNFIENVAFSSPELVKLAERYDLFPAKLIRNQTVTATQMRKRLEVDIYQDYFT